MNKKLFSTPVLSSQWTKRWVFICLFFVFCSSLIYNLFLRASLQREALLESRIHLYSSELQALQQYQFNQGQFEKEKATIAKKIQQIEQALPSEWNLSEILKNLNQAIQESELVMKQQFVSEEIQFDHHAELQFTLELAGQFSQLLHFVRRISNLPILMNIRFLQITNPNLEHTVPHLNIETQISVYIVNSRLK